MRYITDCPNGRCYLEIEQTEHIRAKSSTGGDTKHHVCKEHGGRVILRETVCQKCGKTFEAYKCGPLSKFCPTCQEKRHKAAVKKTNRQRYGKKPVRPNYKNKNLRDPERSDCINRRECLALYDEYEAIPCKNCKNYKQQDFFTDDIQMSRQGELSRVYVNF